jgi:hypothetical protein
MSEPLAAAALPHLYRQARSCQFWTRRSAAKRGAVIPNGLDKALKHIGGLAPKLEGDVRFQRLLTLSRR